LRRAVFNAALVPDRKPRTEWGCQPVAFLNSFRMTPPDRFSRSRTLAVLLPSRALAVLARFAPFWLWARASAGLAFFPDFGLLGATRGFRGGTVARLVAFGGCAGATGWVVARSSLFDVMVNLLVRQNAEFRTSVPPMRLKSKWLTRWLVGHLSEKNPHNLVDFLWIIP
jgi:hypothetical protein